MHPTLRSQFKKKILNYLEMQEIKYVDIDLMLDKILKKHCQDKELKRNGFQRDSTLLLKIRNELEMEISKFFDNNLNQEIIVIDYTILEDSFHFDKCDLVIKAQFNNNDFTDENVIKINKINSLEADYNSSKYHLVLNFDEEWETKFQEYMDFNVNNNTKISVVVPIYNTVEYLTRCINSITNQTYRNLEIILINDGSTDQSLDMCKLLAQNDKRIQIVNQENIGLAETRNKGMSIATGEYICFFDSDDYIENDMIETLLKVAKKTSADVCESSFYIHMKNGETKDVSCEQKGITYIEGKRNLINAYSDATILIPAWDKLYKLNAIKDIKFDSSCFKEDSDYIYKLCMADKTFALVNKPFYHYIKRKETSLTGSKISSRLFSLSDWGKEKYSELLNYGDEYREAAEKILYNSLVHILRNFMRDHINGVLMQDEFKEEIQLVTNDTVSLLLITNNVSKFRKLDEVLEIINILITDRIIEKEKMPSIELPCIGILWNSLDENMKKDAVNFIRDNTIVVDQIEVDLGDSYRQFIDEIYFYNNEFEGIPVIKSGTLIDKYDSNSITILNMALKVSNYVYQGKLKGYLFEEVAILKNSIRKNFKHQIKDYAYDNIFHLTVDEEEYNYTDSICKKLVKGYKGNNNEK